MSALQKSTDITIWNTLKQRGICFFLFSVAHKQAPPPQKDFLFDVSFCLHGDYLFFCLAWRETFMNLFLLNVCVLLSHQHVYPGVSGQQWICTMWRCLQPGALYSLSFPDLSHAHSHQSDLCNLIPCFPFFFFFSSPLFVSIWPVWLCCVHNLHQNQNQKHTLVMVSITLCLRQ